ncbi:hypothetical protein [Methylocaldum sp. GT1TLB]|uniref:hypothetical protein n=1 Tax=unclassified Methylocaldum TaxID=2622260 RepID=UPI003D9FF502
MKVGRVITIFALILTTLAGVGCRPAKDNGGDARHTRVIHADVVAIEHDIQYNRFGSHNPYGMIYALERDVESSDGQPELRPGKVRLKSVKRARPLALRAHKGDILEVTFTNLLSPERPKRHPDDIEEEAIEEKGHAANQVVSAHRTDSDPCAPAGTPPPHGNTPTTRCASIALSGLRVEADGHDPAATGLQGIPPGATITYRWRAEREGTFLFASLAAPSGGEGDGGSLVHGLFGTVTVEPERSTWYRSAVRADELKEAKRQAKAPALIEYEALDEHGDPVLNLLKPLGNDRFELIHSPLDAIIVDHDSGKSGREFTVTFHDELKTVYPEDFRILATNPQLAGVRDGFAINYGASGMGTILLANRLGKGPAKDCVDCLYEEFFLQSWANGDPALLPQYEDDPSNVHHSYLGDPVLFRNSHAGPKETHVFHLHAHQWESSRSGYSNYLDSQTIAPQQSFAYAIAHEASGNRNLAPGDSIFHCHLYPHFAQGMWGLWRVHDVFEDGTRRLPDGERGPGTDPRTGVATGGTPIPAVIPLPELAIAPAPTYAEDPDPSKRIAQSFPGFPFYIPGQAGHRAPQPPLDIVENGGLGRHLVTGGEREFNGGRTAAEQLANADMTAHITRANLILLPEAGTALEKAAMAFHEHAAGYPSRTPEGRDAVFRVNGKARRPGAPFADPCGEDPTAPIRRYRASVIDLDIQTNEHGWHDPQSRINVLDRDVARYEGKKTAAAEPFFFRVESGECVEFLHTNRAGATVRRDDFQVATPTDTIGQHIHLVKFDVLAADGSGNGFNYEDGTLAWEAIKELSEASRFGVVKDHLGQIKPKPRAKTNKQGRPVFQTTIQRWWADAHDHKDGDGTLGTVFTHDHFAPSSIQHHGFYNAMLVEPKGSVWRTPDGTDMKTGKRRLPGGNEQNVAGASRDIACRAPVTEPERTCRESFAVGSRGMVVKAEAREKHPDTREFALAIADFALLYDAGQTQGPALPEGMAGKVNTTVEDYYVAYRKLHGYPVDPPAMPEAISTDHHNPYLVNYKHEPIPLRIGERDSPASGSHFSKLKPGECAGHLDDPESARPALCRPSDLAYVFSSSAPHGDPFLKPFRAYEGDRVQLRVIQGAQEVQHGFTVHGLAWRREAKNPTAPWINAQEIGISEHFEMDTVNLANIGAGLGTADYLFHFGTQDDLWNGSWGLLRAFASPEVFDPAACEDEHGVLKVGQVDLLEASAPDKDAAQRKPFIDKLRQAGCAAQPVARQHLDGPNSCPDGGRSDDHCALAVLDDNTDGRISDPQAGQLVAGDGCPRNAPRSEYAIEAWQVKDLLGERGMRYDDVHGLDDPDGLVFVPAGDVEAIRNGKPLTPLVLRVKAGHCAVVKLTNHLGTRLSDRPGDALMPRITQINVDEHNEGLLDAPPSNRVSLHPQLVAVDVNAGNGAVAGFNRIDKALAVPGETRTYNWFAGRVNIDRKGGKVESLVIEPFNEPLAAGLNSHGDVIGHGTHGLIGALIIEPADAKLFDPEDFYVDSRGRPHGTEIPFERASGLSAVVWEDDTKNYAREFVVVYQDGLNLHKNGQPVPDCRICDDSYDLGEQGINYHSAPFWVRMGLDPHPNAHGQETQDLNDNVFANDFFTDDRQPLAFVDFEAKADERLRFHVVHPAGRARQHSFQLYGHSFKDDVPNFGSPWSRLVTPGVTLTAEVERAKPGIWLYRDGPAHLFAGGTWGRLVVRD